MWLYIPIYEILFSIPVVVIFYFLFKKFWQFRLLSATLGMIIITFLPVMSIYLAYISITEESLFFGIIVGVIQLVLGWTVCAIPLYFCAKPYLNYVKECFEKKDTNKNPYSKEIRKDFLSEKNLADRLSKKLGELAKKNKR